MNPDLVLVDDVYVNLRQIVTITKRDNGSARLQMSNGTTVNAPNWITLFGQLKDRRLI